MAMHRLALGAAFLALCMAGGAWAGGVTSVTGTLTGAPTALGGTMNFPSQPVNTTSPAQTETLTVVMSANDGAGPVPIPPGFVTRFVGASVNNAEYAITGGTCVPNLDLLNGENCTLQLAFTPAAGGVRAGVLSVQCTVIALVGVITLACDNLSHPFMLLSGIGNVIAAIATEVPALGPLPLTALALLLFGASVLAMRRRR